MTEEKDYGIDILTVLVGSKLHGLDTPESDEDRRGVYVPPLLDHVDPYVRVPETRWIEGVKDDTSYEVGKFCFEAAKGSPNSLEVLFSNQVITTTLAGRILMDNADKFLNTERIYKAHQQYAHNQTVKMNMYEPDPRTPKFAVAYARSLMQGVMLLRDGCITNPVPDIWGLPDGSIVRMRDVLFEVKSTRPENWLERDIPTEMGHLFSMLHLQLTNAYLSDPTRFTPDTEWISRFVRNTYSMPGGLE